MLRYQYLLSKSLEEMTVRELSAAAGIPIGSISDHINRDILPRMETLRKIVRYYNEPLSALMCEHSEFTADLITKVSKMTKKEQKALLDYLSDK